MHKTCVQHIDISSISKSIVGRTDINRHVKDMFSKAKSNVVVVSTQEHLERNVKLLKGLMPSFSKKGIKARLYAPYNKNILKKVQNVEHKEYNASTSFVCIDRKEMVFMVSNANAAPDFEVAIWISSPFFVNTVNVLFEESLK